MKESSNHNKQKFSRESIIGLGEDSFRKNYYPELQGKIVDLEKINARNRAIIKTIPDLLLVSDEKGNISPYSSLKTTNKDLMINFMNDPHLMRALRSCIKEIITTREMITFDFTHAINKDEHYFEARVNISDINEILIIIRDVTEQKLLEKKLRDMADRDSMTKLYNRRIFEQKARDLHGTKDHTVAFVFIDIDGLKLLNDTLGHQFGDDVIITVAKTISSVFSENELTSRLSGDEFGIIIENQGQLYIEAKIDMLKERIHKLNTKDDKSNISISTGYALHESGVLDSRLLFKEADNNMYQNKMFKASSVRSGIVKTLMKALEARDYITEGHADRMEIMANHLGISIGLSQNQLDKIKLLAKFHDIGKVGIPDHILNKPSRLTDEEYRVMKTHTQIGQRIAKEANELKEIADLIYAHHERWDGRGYPDGISGEDIAIECRILSIVDTYDAMTNDRPYRKALDHTVAMEEIINNSGTQFDPNLVERFVEYMDTTYQEHFD